MSALFGLAGRDPPPAQLATGAPPRYTGKSFDEWSNALTTKYLLPCPCGRTIPIERRHAGQTVTCECGSAVQAPTLREIAALPQAQADAAAPAAASAWGWPQRTVLAGAVLLAVALVGGLILGEHRPISPSESLTPALMRSQIDTLSPLRSVQFFHMQKATGLAATKLPPEVEYQQARVQFLACAVLLSLLGIAGGTMITLGIVAARAGRTK